MFQLQLRSFVFLDVSYKNSGEAAFCSLTVLWITLPLDYILKMYSLFLILVCEALWACISAWEVLHKVFICIINA